jgi:DNA-binding transcriptional LysR family regulator
MSVASVNPCDLDLRAVRCLLVLAEERHYARAAKRLHMSQPGLSRAINSLEQRIGVILIQRSVRPVALTPQGEILATHGERLLQAQDFAFKQLLESTLDHQSSALQYNGAQSA